jgi:hypothetical protein
MLGNRNPSLLWTIEIQGPDLFFIHASEVVPVDRVHLFLLHCPVGLCPDGFLDAPAL